MVEYSFEGWSACSFYQKNEVCGKDNKGMVRYQKIKERLLSIAEQNGDVQAIIAIGSTVRDYAKADEFSDMDLILATDEPNQWLYGDYPEMLGEIKISFVEKTIAGGMERRLIYAGGLDVDLIVLTPEQLEDAVEKGVSEQVMNRGYVVLYDNMDIAVSIKENVEVRVKQRVISEKEFINLVEDFWFHTVWASKKILRGELWTAKMCIDAYLKNLLLRVMESEALASEKSDVWHNGRFLEKWAGEDTVIALESCFARYEKNSMIFALLQTAGLFGKLAHSVAELCHYEYPQKAEAYAYELQGDYFAPQSTCLYEESDSAFWDDEHISKHMLRAHLNPDCDNASRKQGAIVNSVNWIESVCGACTGKKLLDLGCGPGIYAELLAEKGFQVTGIDFSKRSIDYAIQSAANKKLDIKYHYQNYLAIDYKETFDVAILIYCDFGVLSPDDRKVLLGKIHQALKPEGILILDAFSEFHLNSFKELQSVQCEQEGFWSKEPYVVIQQNKYYQETANTLEQYLVITEEDSKQYNIWNQLYTKETLMKEVGQVGFEKAVFFDDVQGSKYSGLGDTICGVFSKEG